MIYIWKIQEGYYVETDSLLDEEYWNGQIGSTYQDFLDGKWVLLSNEQVIFHNEHPEASISQVLSMTLYERTVIDAKEQKLLEIDNYDKSPSINEFIISSQGQPVATSWLTPEERANYKNSIDAAKLIGLDTLSLYIDEIPITLTTQQAELMLAQIQLYADQCFIITKRHKANVQRLETIEEVDNYDITTDYPTKLIFSIDNNEEPEQEEE